MPRYLPDPRDSKNDSIATDTRKLLETTYPQLKELIKPVDNMFGKNQWNKYDVISALHKIYGDELKQLETKVNETYKQ